LIHGEKIDVYGKIICPVLIPFAIA
jgi:hypothetical protein